VGSQTWFKDEIYTETIILTNLTYKNNAFIMQVSGGILLEHDEQFM
jgi:hypothetical protein